MKNVLIVPALWALAVVAVCGQTVDGKRIDQDTSIHYVKVMMADAGKFGKTRYRVSVDYGQQPGGNQNFTIMDDQGKPREWASDMEVANYFAGFGWRLMYQYRQILPGSNLQADHLVFEKR